MPYAIRLNLALLNNQMKSAQNNKSPIVAYFHKTRLNFADHMAMSQYRILCAFAKPAGYLYTLL